MIIGIASAYIVLAILQLVASNLFPISVYFAVAIASFLLAIAELFMNFLSGLHESLMTLKNQSQSLESTLNRYITEIQQHCDMTRIANIVDLSESMIGKHQSDQDKIDAELKKMKQPQIKQKSSFTQRMLLQWLY